jgi:hypothetical protein
MHIRYVIGYVERGFASALLLDRHCRHLVNRRNLPISDRSLIFAPIDVKIARCTPV